jgi:hypothetical protein
MFLLFYAALLHLSIKICFIFMFNLYISAVEHKFAHASYLDASKLRRYCDKCIWVIEVKLYPRHQTYLRSAHRAVCKQGRGTTTEWLQGWVDLRESLDAVAKKKFVFLSEIEAWRFSN